MAEFDDLDLSGIPTVDDSKNVVKGAVFANEGVNPDQRAEAIKLAERFKTPVEFVERNFDSFKTESSKPTDESYDDLVNNFPNSADFVSDPINAGLVMDGFDSIKSIEQKSKNKSYYDKFTDRLKSGALNMAAGLNEFAEMNRQQAEQDFAEMNKNNQLPKELQLKPQSLITKEMSDKYRQQLKIEVSKYENEDAQKSFVTELKNGNWESATKALTLQIIESLPQLAVTAMAPRIGLSILFASETGGKYKENVDAGIDPEKARLNARITGGISAAFESIGGYGNPLKSILKRTEKELGRQTLFEILKRSGKEVAKGGFEEGAEEFGTSIAQDLTDYSMGVNPKALDGMVTRAADGFFVGFGSGGFIGTIHHAPTSVRRYTESQRAEINTQTYTELGEDAKQNKLRKRSPEKYEKFVNANPEIGKTYIQPESLDQYYQTKGLSTSEELAKLGMLEAYEKALQTGADVILPTGTFINKSVDSDLYNAIKDDIKFNPNDITAKEIKKQNSDLKEEIKKQKELADKNEAEGKEIVSDVYKQIVEAGRPPSEAKAASILFNAIEAMAVREGQSPKELYDRYGLKIINAGSAPVILEGDVYNQTKGMFDGQTKKQQIQQNKEKLEQQGFKFNISEDPYFSDNGDEIEGPKLGEPDSTFTVYAEDSTGNDIGQARFRVDEYGDLYPDDNDGGTEAVTVDASFRRQGIATELYRLASETLGKPIQNQNGQSSDGKKFRDYLNDMDDDVFYQTAGQAPPMFSKLTQTVEQKVPNNASPEQIMATLKEMKPEEIKWSGIDTFLKGKTKVDKKELVDFLRANELRIVDVTLGAQNISEEKIQAEMQKLENQEINDALDSGNIPTHFAEELDDGSGWKVYGEYADESVYKTQDEAEQAAQDFDDNARNSAMEMIQENINRRDLRNLAIANLNDNQSPTKFEDYTLSGGENYREVLFTLPEAMQEKITELPKDFKIEKHKPALTFGDQKAEVYIVVNGEGADKQNYVYGATEEQAVKSALNKLNREGLKNNYTSSHFKQKNIVAHVRLNDRVDTDGNKVLHVEEIQSDWHQDGRKEGYESDVKEEKPKPMRDLGPDDVTVEDGGFSYTVKLNDKDLLLFSSQTQDITVGKGIVDSEDGAKAYALKMYNEAVDKKNTVAESNFNYKNQAKVPDAPFKKTWHEFAMKRIIRMAADGGYDKVTWTTGDQQALRYQNALLKKVDKFYVHKKENGLYDLIAEKDLSTVVEETDIKKDRIGELVGKSLGGQLIELAESGKVEELKGDNFNIGGGGMRGFYDKILVDYANKFGKKFNAKVGKTNIEAPILGNSKEDLRSWKESIDKLKAQKEIIDDTSKEHVFEEVENRDGVTVLKHDRLPISIVTYLDYHGDSKTIAEWNDRKQIATYKTEQLALDNIEKDSSDFLNTIINFEEKNYNESVKKTADGVQVHSMEITPELKDAALTQGFPLFQQGDKIQGSYDPLKRLISLFTEANKTTPLHEFGHFFLDVMSDLATSETASEGMKKDYAEVLKFLGVNSKEEIKRPQHELWARSFEAYLMEGQAPSPTMRKAFDSFKLWMIEAYRNIEGLAARAGFPIKLTDEIRGVFDRLISVEQVIDDASADLGINALLKNPIADGMNKDMAEKYTEAIKDSRAYSESVLNKKLLDALNKKQSKEYKNKFNIEFSTIKKELMLNPVYNALQSLRTGKDNLGRTFDLPVKINRQTVVTAFGEEIANKLPRSVYNKDGLHYEAAAEFFGFESSSEFITDMAQAEDIDSVARKQAEANLKGQFPDLFNDPEIMPEAVMALHNEKRGEALGYELEYLAEKHNALFKDAIRRIVKRAPTKAEVQLQAKKLIANEMVGDIKPHQFLNAERRMSKEAGKALASGDLAKAFEYKKAEYLNYELYRAAAEAQTDVEKTVKKFKKIFKLNEDINKSRDLDYVNTARAVLSLYGIVGGKNEAPLDYLKKTEKYDPERFASIESILQGALEGAGQYDRVSYDKFTEMKNTVDALWDISKDAKEIVINGKAVALETAINELKATLEIDKKSNGNINIAGSVSDEEKRATGILGYIASNKIVLNWADLVDRGNANGAVKKYIWYPVAEAAAKYRDKSFKLKQLFVQIVKDHAEIFDDKKVYSGDELEIEAGQADLLGNKSERVTFSFKKSEIIMMLLHSGNASNKSKLLRGGRNYKGQQYAWGSTDSEGNLDSLNFDKMFARWRKEGVLTAKDYKFAQHVWDLMESVKGDVQKAHKKTEGYYFNEISASEIKNEFGTFRGGYMPAKVDIYTDETAELRAEKEKFENTNPSFSFPTISKGATMTRVDAYAKPLSLDFNLVKSHLDWTMKFAHLRPAIKDTNKIVSNEKFRNALRGVDEVAGKEMLAPWLQRSAEQNIIMPSQGDGKYLDAAARWLRTRFAMNALAGSLTNALQNFGSSIISTSKVPPKYVLRASFDLVKNREKSLNFITENSDFMKGELNSDAARVLNQADDIITNASGYEVIADNIRLFSNVMDTMTTSYIKSHVWLGSYNYQMDNGVGHLVAKRLSDDLTRSVTSTINAEDVPRSMTGTQSKIFFTQFIGYFNRILNFRASEMAKIHKDFGLASYEGMKRAIPLIMLAGIIPAAYQAVVSKAVAGRLGDDEDGDGYLDEIMSAFFGSLFKETVVAVPVLGQVGVGLMNTFNNRPNDDKVTLAPAVSLIDLAIKLPKGVIEGAAKSELKKQTVKDAFTAVGAITNLPVGFLGKPVGYLIDVDEGKANPKNELDFARGLISGQAGK